MNLSLREQLLKAGLVTEKEAKQAERAASDQRHRQAKTGRRSPRTTPEATRVAERARAEKLLRDQALNRKQQEKAARKARAAELRQLVEQLRVARPESDDYFNFVDGGRIRRLQVTPDLRARLIAGSLAIVRHGERYDLVATEQLERIRERHPEAVVATPSAREEAMAPAEDDPYKDFVVPDDLMW